jgi:hypothetical protein
VLKSEETRCGGFNLPAGHCRQAKVHKILFINYIVAFFRFLVTLGMTSDIVKRGREKGGLCPPFSLPTIPI